MRLVSKSSSQNCNSRVDKTNIIYKSLNDSMFMEQSPKSNNPGELDVNGHTSYYVGRHIINQSYRRVPDPMIEVYHKYKLVFDSFSVTLNDTIIVDGCFKTNKPTLQRTMIPETDSEYTGMPSMLLIRNMKNSIKATIRKLKISTLAKCEKEDMNHTVFNMDTYPGFLYKEYMGIRSVH